jgi:histidinol-phosphatase
VPSASSHDAHLGGAVLTSRPGFASLLAFAHELADASAIVIHPYFRRPLAVTNKARDGAFDPVTAADRAAERTIRRAVATRFPDHGLIGEELGQVRRDARFCWVIDPIDGTRAFIMGTPLWGTLIGLLDGEDVVLGLMNQPFTGERFWSGAGAAYARTGAGKARRLKTRACSRLADAVLSTTHPDLFARGKEADAFARLKAKARMTRYGGDCYAYCLLAAGFIDIVVEAGLKTHDVAALIPIIERAGGRITGWAGGGAIDGGRIVAAGDARLHEEALQILNR